MATPQSTSTPSEAPAFQAPNGNGHGPDDYTVNIGLRGAFVEQRQVQPTQNVVAMFLSFNPVPEEAWLKAGLPLRELAIKRRIIHNFNYIMYGVTDVMGDQYISLAGWAGHDRKAWESAERVATQVRVLPGMDEIASRVRNVGRRAG